MAEMKYEQPDEDKVQMIKAFFNQGVEEAEKLYFELQSARAEKKEIQTDLQRDREKQLGYVEIKDELLMEADVMSEFIKDMAKFVDKQLLEKVERGEMHISLERAAEEIHKNAVEHGWWEGERRDAEVRALIHSEWSEALEEARAGRPMEWYACKHGDRICDPDLNCPLNVYKVEECPMRIAKPEGVAVELIDGVIRILDWMGKEGYVFPDGFNAHVSGAKMLCREFPEHKLDLSKIPAAEIVDWLHTETATESWAEGMGYEHCVCVAGCERYQPGSCAFAKACVQCDQAVQTREEVLR